MNRLIVSLTILLLCFSISLGEYTYLESTCTQLYETLEDCADTIKTDRISQGKEKAKEIEELFEEKKHILSVILGDEMIDELRYKIPSIRELLSEDNKAKALETLHECSYMAREIHRNEKIALDNIF